jgi:hypothetical protein
VRVVVAVVVAMAMLFGTAPVLSASMSSGGPGGAPVGSDTIAYGAAKAKKAKKFTGWKEVKYPNVDNPKAGTIKFYYKNGVKFTGWRTVDGGKYFYKKGLRYTGWDRTKGKLLYYDGGKRANGLIEVGSRPYDSKYVTTIGEGVYYFKNGVSQGGWQQVGGYELYFKESGDGKYVLDSSRSTGFVSLDLEYVVISKYKLEWRDSTTFEKIDPSHPAGSRSHFSTGAPLLYAVKRKVGQLYFYPETGQLARGTLDNANVLTVDGAMYYVKPDGLINPEKTVLGFHQFPDGGWYRFIYTKFRGEEGGSDMFKFGARQLTGDPAQDSDAFAKLEQLLNTPWSEKTEAMYDSVFCYDWTKYKVYLGTPVNCYHITGPAEKINDLMFNYKMMSFPKIPSDSRNTSWYTQYTALRIKYMPGLPSL